MIETIVKVDGMMCGMCEGHINDAIRSHFPVKKVSSSHSKGRTVDPVPGGPGSGAAAPGHRRHRLQGPGRGVPSRGKARPVGPPEKVRHDALMSA